MRTTSVPMNAYRVTAFCDICGEELKSTGRALLTSPPRYPYECKNGHQETLDKNYPYIEWETA